MANNPTSPDKLRELAPRLLSRKDIIMRAKYGAALGARTNPAVEQWFINREAELAKRKASELVMTAFQQPEPAELQTQQAVSELQTAREVEIMNRDKDIAIAEALRNVEEARNTIIPAEGHDELAA